MNKKDTQFTIFLKSLSILISSILIGGLLVSCGSSQAEIALKQEQLALKANCERILSNLQAINRVPDGNFRTTYVSDALGLAVLNGEETQKNIEREILTRFPFLDEAIVGRTRDKQWNLPHYDGVIFLVSQALAGTDIEFPYSSEEMKTIARQENGWSESVSPLADKLFGSNSDSIYDEEEEKKNHQGCSLIDLSKQDANMDNQTSVAFDRAYSHLLNFERFLQAIRNCQVSRWHENEKCPKLDYVSDPSDYTPPSTDPSDEELAILAEREEAAEREAERPSDSVETSNAKPFQICGALGKLVQTESYGELQCRVIWTNRVKALIWMRTGRS